MEARGIAEGMSVRASDGKKLGTVIECGAEQFLVEKGLFFPKDYGIRYDDVETVADGEVRLRWASAELIGKAAEHPTRSGDEDRPTARGNPPGLAGGVAAASGEATAAGASSTEEVRVPLVSEELEIEKRERQAGEVRVKKDVVTEEKQLRVPVTREEVHVERVPIEGSPPAGEAAFQEKTVTVPIREEDVEVHKRPVVREEVRVGKVRREEERRADAEVRREEARVERDPEHPGREDEPEP